MLFRSDVQFLKGFSDKVRGQLRKNRMMQYELAKASGISERTLSRYFTYRSMPSIDTVYRIAEALNCTVDDLMPKDYIRTD